MEWQPLSVRQGVAEPDDGPFEGIPGHLEHACSWWVRRALADKTGWTDESLANLVAVRLRIVVEGHSSELAIWKACDERGPDFLLDAVDLVLWQTGGKTAQDLEALLYNGASVWTVAEDGRSLVRRVSETEQQAYAVSLSAEDEIAQELRTAWRETYGLNPDPSDAWDHAIKATELALWPIVMPNNKQATLGAIAGQLGSQPEQFALRLTTSGRKTTSVETLVQMLRLIWPNPDRHGTAVSRTPTQKEAENVVQLAVLIVNWIRTGALTVRVDSS